jgi:LacI family transcriptional regulator
MGHDNWEPIASGARPPLTSIDMCLEELGKLAAARLVQAIEGRSSSGVELIGSRLITRKSTAPQD